jgi:hypothetical protein
MSRGYHINYAQFRHHLEFSTAASGEKDAETTPTNAQGF